MVDENYKKDIKVIWKIPKRTNNRSWKINQEGGGLENNFIIHLISILFLVLKFKSSKKSRKKYFCINNKIHILLLIVIMIQKKLF